MVLAGRFSFFDYFVLLSVAGWYRILMSGGGFFLAERTCKSGKLCYNHDTLERDECSLPGGRISLTHTVDPYWSWSGRLWGAEKYLAAPVGGLKIGGEKPPSIPVNANSEKRNSKWSWL